MPIDVNPTVEEVNELHDDLKAYEASVAAYLASRSGQADPNYESLSKLDISLNLKIYNLSIQSLTISTDQAGAAADAINNSISELKALQEKKIEIANDLTVIQSVVTFASALLSGNAGSIVQTGAALYKTLQNKQVS